MFEDPGQAYVYFIYGNFEMLNFVTEKKGTAGAMLVRAVERFSKGQKLNYRFFDSKSQWVSKTPYNLQAVPA